MRDPSLDGTQSATSIQQPENASQTPKWPIPKTLTGSGHISRKSSSQTLKSSLSPIVERHSDRSSGVPPIPIRPSTPEKSTKGREAILTPETVIKVQSHSRLSSPPGGQDTSPLANKNARTRSTNNYSALDSDLSSSPKPIREIYNNQKLDNGSRQRSISLQSQSPNTAGSQQLPSSTPQLPPLNKTGHMRHRSMQLFRHESIQSASSCNTSILGDVEPYSGTSSPEASELKWQFSEHGGFLHYDGRLPSKAPQDHDKPQGTTLRLKHRRKESENPKPSPTLSESNHERYRRNSNYITKLADSARVSPEKLNSRLPSQPSPPAGKVYDDVKYYLSATDSGSPEPKPPSSSTLKTASGNSMGPLSAIGEKRKLSWDESSLSPRSPARSTHQRSNTVDDTTQTPPCGNQQIAPVANMSSTKGDQSQSTATPPVFSALGLVFESQETDAVRSPTLAPNFTLPPKPLHLTSPASPPTPSRNPALHRRSLKAQKLPQTPSAPSPSFHSEANDEGTESWPLKPFIPPSTASKPTPISSHVGPISPNRLSTYIGPVSPSTALSSRWTESTPSTTVRVPRGPRTQPAKEAASPQRPPKSVRARSPSKPSSPLKNILRYTPSPLPIPDHLSPSPKASDPDTLVIPSIIAPEGDGGEDIQSTVRNLRRMNSTAESEDGAERNFLKLGRESMAPDDIYATADSVNAAKLAGTVPSNTLTPYSHSRIRKPHLRSPSLASAFRNLSSESVAKRQSRDDDSDSDSDVSPKTQVDRAFAKRALAEKEDEIERLKERVKEEEERRGLSGNWFDGGVGDLEVRSGGDGVHFMVPRGMRKDEEEEEEGEEGDELGLGLFSERWVIPETSPRSLYDGKGFLRESPGLGRRVGVWD